MVGLSRINLHPEDAARFDAVILEALSEVTPEHRRELRVEVERASTHDATLYTVWYKGKPYEHIVGNVSLYGHKTDGMVREKILELIRKAIDGAIVSEDGAA